MMILQRSDTNNAVSLTKEIASSGEGKIYKTNEQGLIAKIYHKVTPEKISKLKVMVANPPNDPTVSSGHISIAWPRCLLRDSSNSNQGCVGFLMPEIYNAKTLINVYNHKLRAKNASGADWYYLHSIAQSVAYIVQVIHAKGYVIGDIKPENLLVNSRGLISIIDTDSFQITDHHSRKIYRCPVGSPEYTPREMFHVDFTTRDRSELQDRFGLSVIIWLLIFGQHPFTGKWIGSGESPNIDELIRQGYWQYAPNSKIRSSFYSIPLNIVDSNIQQGFNRCFVNGHKNPYERPSAADWVKLLDSARKKLQTCQVQTTHRYADIYGRCYWCERKNMLNGIDVFPSPQFTPPQAPPSFTKPLQIPTLISKIPIPAQLNSVDPKVLWVAVLIFLALTLKVLG